MIIEESKKMMRKSFLRTLYRFREVPEAQLHGAFGIYIHVPFCITKCSFCPFYKETFSEDQKRAYVEVIQKEINNAKMTGTAQWIYFGGGTPNLLSLQDLRAIVDCIKNKVDMDSLGIELLPALANGQYLEGLKRIGFTKISIGVESFSDEVITKTGRKMTTYEHIKNLVDSAKLLGLWVNVDMMVGLPHQDAHTFLQDIRTISILLPKQVTIYPLMVIRGLSIAPSICSRVQFGLIEQAGEILRNCGYNRKGVWIFTIGDDIYDSSRDELVQDYIGFGPAAFSTYGQWKVVNPELDGYLKNGAN